MWQLYYMEIPQSNPVPIYGYFFPQLLAITKKKKIYQHLCTYIFTWGTNTYISRSWVKGVYNQKNKTTFCKKCYWCVCPVFSLVLTTYIFLCIFFPIQDTTPQLICKLEAQVIYFFCIPPTLPSPQILVKLKRFQGAGHIHPLQPWQSKYLPQVILEFHDHILAHKGLEKGIEELLGERGKTIIWERTW